MNAQTAALLNIIAGSICGLEDAERIAEEICLNLYAERCLTAERYFRNAFDRAEAAMVAAQAGEG